MPIILACECGARVKAPGAIPGRTGRCPRCGAPLRVPDGPPAAEPIAPAGYALREPRPAATATSAPDQPVRFRKPPRPMGDAAPLDPGLLAPPKQPERAFRASLRYPLWSGSGLALLAVFPPLCEVASIFSIGLRDYVLGDNEVMSLGAMTMVFPASCLLALFLAAGLRFLDDVLETTTRGEVAPPRWPHWDLFETLGALIRWIAALGLGLALGGVLAWIYTRSLADAPPEARSGYVAVLIAALFGSGAALWPIPVLAVTLHRDPLAANPFTVLATLFRCGPGLLGLSLLFGVAGAVMAGVVPLLYHLPIVLPVILGVYLYWVAFWYLAMILTRRLGLFYRRHRSQIGWFA